MTAQYRYFWWTPDQQSIHLKKEKLSAYDALMIHYAMSKGVSGIKSRTRSNIIGKEEM